MAQPKVGYIEGRPNDREKLFKLLQLHQMTPYPMRSAAEFGEVRRSIDFDLILCSVRREDQTPLELLSILKDLSTIPLILLCNFECPIDRIIALEAGCDDVVLVPYDSKELIARIRALIRRSKSSGRGA